MMRIRSEQDQKNAQLEQYNQLQQQQLESSRQHVTQLERRVEGLMQQCRLKDEANSQNSELYKKLDAADKMINVFQVKIDNSYELKYCAKLFDFLSYTILFDSHSV